MTWIIVLGVVCLVVLLKIDKNTTLTHNEILGLRDTLDRIEKNTRRV